MLCIYVLNKVLLLQYRDSLMSYFLFLMIKFPRFLPRRHFLLDMAPTLITLLSMIASTLRPLSAQLYNQHEKLALDNLVNLMLNLGLNLLAEQDSESNEVQYQLNP